MSRVKSFKLYGIDLLLLSDVQRVWNSSIYKETTEIPSTNPLPSSNNRPDDFPQNQHMECSFKAFTTLIRPNQNNLENQVR